MYPAIDERAVREAARVLLAGGLVAIPTETVYGLAADADNREAVLATFAVKGRPTNHPLIVHVKSAEALPFWARDIPDAAWLLAKKFWPGPLTMVLPRGERCGTFVTGGQDTVAIRCPSHPWVQALLSEISGSTMKGFTAPSCNTFGRISPTSARHVLADLGVKPEGKLDYVLDGGRCEVGVESTILDLSGDHPQILRHGAVTRAMLEEALGVPVPDAGSAAPRVPGTLKSHYAPATRLELVPRKDFANRIGELSGLKLAVMASKDLLAGLPGSVVLALTAPEGAAPYASFLYEALHELDQAGADRILIEQPPQDPAWAAVNDRLGRASA